MNQFQSLSFFYIVFLFWWNTLSLRRRRRAMFWFLFKTGFVFIVPENVAVLHSPKVWFKAQPAPAWSWYCQKLPTGNFSGAACWIWQFVKTFSLAEKWIENKFSIWSLLFLPIKDWAKLPSATEQNSFQTFKNALSRIKSFALCGVRQGRCPLETHHPLEKVDENFNLFFIWQKIREKLFVFWEKPCLQT